MAKGDDPLAKKWQAEKKKMKEAQRAQQALRNQRRPKERQKRKQQHRSGHDVSSMPRWEGVPWPKSSQGTCESNPPPCTLDTDFF